MHLLVVGSSSVIGDSPVMKESPILLCTADARNGGLLCSDRLGKNRQQQADAAAVRLDLPLQQVHARLARRRVPPFFNHGKASMDSRTRAFHPTSVILNDIGPPAPASMQACSNRSRPHPLGVMERGSPRRRAELSSSAQLASVIDFNPDSVRRRLSSRALQEHLQVDASVASLPIRPRRSLDLAVASDAMPGGTSPTAR